MTLGELKNALGDNNTTKYQISAAELYNIQVYVNPSLEMDRGTLDYYYSIDVNELLASNMPVEDLEDLKKQGWSLTENDKDLIYKTKAGESAISHDVFADRVDFVSSGSGTTQVSEAATTTGADFGKLKKQDEQAAVAAAGAASDAADDLPF